MSHLFTLDNKVMDAQGVPVQSLHPWLEYPTQILNVVFQEFRLYSKHSIIYVSQIKPTYTYAHKYIHTYIHTYICTYIYTIIMFNA